MAEIREVLVDNIGHVAVTGGIVRLDLERLSTLRGSTENPSFEPAVRLAFSLDTLIKLNQAITATLNGLESKGVIKRNEVDGKNEAEGGAKTASPKK